VIKDVFLNTNHRSNPDVIARQLETLLRTGATTFGLTEVAEASLRVFRPGLNGAGYQVEEISSRQQSLLIASRFSLARGPQLDSFRTEGFGPSFRS
jgi:hypothetical protein